MPVSFVSEPIVPLDSSFDVSGMARGEPGLPHRFRWKKRGFAVARVLDQWKGHGDCAHGSGERYVRRHDYRVETTDGAVLHVYFIRSFGRGSFRRNNRWWLHSIEKDCESRATAAS